MDGFQEGYDHFLNPQKGPSFKKVPPSQEQFDQIMKEQREHQKAVFIELVKMLKEVAKNEEITMDQAIQIFNKSCESYSRLPYAISI